MKINDKYINIFLSINPFNENYKEIIKQTKFWVHYYKYDGNVNFGRYSMPKILLLLTHKKYE